MRKVIVVSIAIFLLNFWLTPVAFAHGGLLFLTPASGSFGIGETFFVEVKVNTAGIPINAAEAVIYFSTKNLEVKNISKEESIFSLWPEEPSFSNLTGEISFVGGLPTPGFSGEGNLITIEFRAKEEGEGHLTFGEGKVLADDGKGTNILVFLKGTKYFVQKTEISPQKLKFSQIFSPTHPKSNEWYNNNNPYFQWEILPDTVGVSFVLDQNPDTIPDEKSEGLVEFKDYIGVADGIWYFHLRFKNKDGWSETLHYKIQIDSLPPYPFDIIIDNKGDSTNPKPDLYFETIDDTSGISSYKLKIGEMKFFDLMLAEINPFTLPSRPPGQWPILVRAMDQAGNIAQARAEIDIEPIASPEIIVWPKTHISGEEVLYLEGMALPEVEVTIFLIREGQILKNWQTFSNGLGEWSFLTKELLKSGTYYLQTQAKDKRGAESLFSESREIEVFFSGISLGPILITFRILTLVLILILSLGIIAAIFVTHKHRQVKKILKKETEEVKESLEQVFTSLEKDIEKRIELIDTQPGFTAEERKACEDIKKALEGAKEKVEKEIKDIEKELK